MNSMRRLPLLREPTVKLGTKRCWLRWPWTGTDFSDFVTKRDTTTKGYWPKRQENYSMETMNVTTANKEWGCSTGVSKSLDTRTAPTAT
jgi:hypothetical protein